MMLTQTYAIEDCLEYQSQITSTISKTITLGTYTSKPCIVEGKMSSTNKGYSIMVQTASNNAIRVGVGGNDNFDIAKYVSSWNTLVQMGTKSDYSTPFSFKFIEYSDKCEVYVNDELKTTVSDLWVSGLNHAGIETWNTGKTMTVTDFKIKPL